MIDCLDLFILLFWGFFIFNDVNYKATLFMLDFRMERTQVMLLRTQGMALLYLLLTVCGCSWPMKHSPEMIMDIRLGMETETHAS